MSLLGIDVGTTGCKAVLFDEEGRELGQGYREYPLHHPEPGLMELDSDLVWTKVKEAIQEAAPSAKGDPVGALAISSLGEAVTPLSSAGRALCPSILGFDPRGEEETQRLGNALGEEKIMALTGMPLSSAYSLPKIMWLMEHRPDIAGEADRFLCYEDLIAMRLGASPSIDFSLAGRTLALDLEKGEWSEEILEAAQLSPDRLSRPVPSGTVIGEVPSSLANELGLNPGIQIVAGGHDQPAGCLGCGVVAPGMAMDATGTVECIAVSLEKAIVNEQMRRSSFCCYHHIVPGQYLTIAFNWTGGSILKWFRDTMAAEEIRIAQESGRDVYDILMERLAPQPTDLLVLPYFTMSGTPHFDENARGLLLGLTLETSRGEIIRALLEGVSLEMRLNLDLLAEAGVPVGSLRAIGGGAKSNDWLQLKADVFGRPVQTVNVSEAAALGMAITAGVGLGTYSNAEEGASQAIRITENFSPAPKRASFYSQRLKTYSQIYDTTKPLVDGLITSNWVDHEREDECV